MDGLERVQREIEEIKLQQVRDFLDSLSPSELQRVARFFHDQLHREPFPDAVEIKLKPKGGRAPESDEDGYKKNVVLKVVAAKLGL